MKALRIKSVATLNIYISSMPQLNLTGIGPLSGVVKYSLHENMPI